VDLFRNHIGTSVVCILRTQSSRLNPDTGPIRSVEFCENGSSMEITFFNPDDAMCVRHLVPPSSPTVVRPRKSLTMSGYMVSGHPM
jgi:hypothetical protein